MNARWLYRWNKLLLLTAALPLLQVSQCNTATNRTLASIANQLPGFVFNGFFSAALQTILEALGAGGATSGLGGGGLGGGGLGGGGI